MGGAVSSGRDNNELIDNLVSGNYIRTREVERVFRALDRADYMTREARDQAYKDLAWRHGPLHLSAPCIYSEVMEGLELSPGLSFLNVGSGTGYLSTLVGLILGSSGISHGVEVHPAVVDYANRRLGQFIENSPVLDEFDFCEPKYFCGNGLCIAPLQAPYDRVYCGAACPEEYQNYFKQLIKVGGILVMPLNENLVQVRRGSETEWSSRSLLNVSFMGLRVPDKREAADLVRLDEQCPVRLQTLCRGAVRSALRGGVWRRHPELRAPTPSPLPAKRPRPRRIMIPIEDDSDVGLNALHDLDRGGGAGEMNALLSLVLSMGPGRVAGALRFDAPDSDDDRENDPQAADPERAEVTDERTESDSRSQGAREADQSESGDPDRGERSDRGGRSDRGERSDRERDTDTDRGERPDRDGVERRSAADRDRERRDRGDRDKSERGDRDRNDRGDKDDRDRSDRGDKGDRDRSDRGDKGDRDRSERERRDRGDRDRRGGDRERRGRLPCRGMLTFELRGADGRGNDTANEASDAEERRALGVAEHGDWREVLALGVADARAESDNEPSRPFVRLRRAPIDDLSDGGSAGASGGSADGGEGSSRGRDHDVPHEVEIYLGKMAGGEATTSREMDWDAEDEDDDKDEDKAEDEDEDEDGDSAAETEPAPETADMADAEDKQPRQKLDSGIGETTPSAASSPASTGYDAGSSRRSGQDSDRADTRSGRRRRQKRLATRRSTDSGGSGSSNSSDSCSRRRPKRRAGDGGDARRVRLSILMKRSVKELPLPYALKKYVNLGRCFEF